MTDLTAILSAWGGANDAPRLISARENVVYFVKLTSGQNAALRLHRAGYQSAAAIRSELFWTEELVKNSFPCPAPIRTEDNDVISITDGQIASLVTWVDAAPIGENAVAFDGSLNKQCELYKDIGRLIRKLHDLTATLDLKAFERPSWDEVALLGDVPVWGKFWENPSLTNAEATFLKEGRQVFRDHLRRLQLPTTLIHADLLQENILTAGTKLHLIDFDDSGFGYRPYDLGTALIQHAEHENLDALTAGLLDGYGAPELYDDMPLFIALRALASCGWIISRAPKNDPRQRFYAERALNCMHSYYLAR